MRLTLAAGDGLNAISCDRLLDGLTRASVRQAPELTIDLNKAAHVDPYGLACLVLVARHVVRQGQRLAIVLPSDEQVQQALAAMGLVQALQGLAELRNVPGIRASSADTTLPLSPVRNKTDVQEVLNFLVYQARSRLGFDVGDVLDATKIVSELCYNVVDHSGDEGLVTARIYSDRQGQRFVSLAVVDGGCGIRASLARRYPEAAAWRHEQAIERALGGLSSREKGGGMGLRNVHAAVRRYSGRLAIRSGSDRLFLSADRQPRTSTGALFPGAQIGISFSQR